MMAAITGRLLLDWIFWAVTAINGIGALALIFMSEGTEDGAGRGMQSGLGVMLLVIVAAFAALYWFFQTPFLRVPVFLIMVLPGLFLAFSRLSQ